MANAETLISPPLHRKLSRSYLTAIQSTQDPPDSPNISVRPPRPRRSPLRPKFDSFKRKRISTEGRNRASSGLSVAGLEGLRQRLSEFRASLRSMKSTGEVAASPRSTVVSACTTAEETDPKISYGTLSNTSQADSGDVKGDTGKGRIDDPLASHQLAGQTVSLKSTQEIDLPEGPATRSQPTLALPSPPLTPPLPLTPPDPLAPPEVRITKPSLPPECVIQTGALECVIRAGAKDTMHPFAAVVAMMDSAPERPTKGKQRARGERPEGQATRNAQGVLVKLASRPSLRVKPSLSKNSSLEPVPPTPTSPLPSANLLRPAPITPQFPHSPGRQFLLSTARTPSPSASLLPTPTFAPSNLNTEMIEIPRFRKKELNFAMVEKRGPWQRLAWTGLWVVWLSNGLLSLFFDVNILYILIQCAIHPSFSTSSSKLWTFATVAYALCLGLSAVVWLAWELGYEYWRRWRLVRPAIEPIHLSLPASLHLALYSYTHFTFLLHVRLSPLGTPFRKDVLPETFHSLAQLSPGLLPLLPRAGIAIALLIAFVKPASQVQSPFEATDQASNRDPRFFRSNLSGELTTYAKGVVFVFVACVGLRLVIVVASLLGLWMFSGSPLGGLVGGRLKTINAPPTTPRKPKSSVIPRDPSQTASPQKNWLDAENEFDWAWRDRTRARVQDAFELCMIRRTMPARCDLRSASARGMGRALSGPLEEGEIDELLRSSGGENVGGGGGLAARPESGVLPTESLQGDPPTNTTSVSSSRDVFYSPTGANTPIVESVHEGPGSYRRRIAEFGRKRNSEESMESLTDDSAGLLTAASTPRVSINGLRERAASIGTGHESGSESASGTMSSRSAQSSNTRKRAASGPSLYRARSTSVSMLRESVLNAAANNALVRRVRSGTMSGESQYSIVSENEGGSEKVR